MDQRPSRPTASPPPEPATPSTADRWVLPRRLDVKLGPIGGLRVAAVAIPSVVARSPDEVGALVEALVAAIVPVGLIVGLAVRTNRRTAGPHDVSSSPPPTAGPKEQPR